MSKNKIVGLLESFSARELTRIRKFLQSPYFNEQEDVVVLFDYLRDEVLSGGAEKDIDKPKIWRLIFKNKPYKDVQLRRLFSDLNLLVNDYLAHRHFRKKTARASVFVMNELQYSNLEKQFEGMYRTADRKLEKSKRRNASYHFDRFLTEKSYHEHVEFKGLKNFTFEHLEVADYHLDCFYITQKLKHYCDALGYENFLSDKAGLSFFSGFLEDVKKEKFIKEPCIKVYVLVSQMLLQPEQESLFNDLKEFLIEYKAIFDKNELATLYTHLINYCIHKKINVGRLEYFHELFELYKMDLKEQIIFSGTEIKFNYYKNIILVGLHIKKFEWVENFIKEYTAKLPEEHRENALNYNLAELYFQRKKYDKVIELLREVEYKNLVYALGGKMLLLKTYYEQGEVSALDFLIDSFRIYLRRNRTISKNVRQQYMNVLRFVKKLSKLAPYDRAGKQKLITEINECPSLAGKNWILEKVEEV